MDFFDEQQIPYLLVGRQESLPKEKLIGDSFIVKIIKGKSIVSKELSSESLISKNVKSNS